VKNEERKNTTKHKCNTNKTIKETELLDLRAGYGQHTSLNTKPACFSQEEFTSHYIQYIEKQNAQKPNNMQEDELKAHKKVKRKKVLGLYCLRFFFLEANLDATDSRCKKVVQ